jgi:hypothetical protein
MGKGLRLATAVVVDRDIDPLAEVLLRQRAIREPVAGEDEGQHRDSLVNVGPGEPRQSGRMTDQPHDSVAPPPPPPPVLPRPPAPATFAASMPGPPGPPAFHPRGTLVATALGGPLKRASWVAGISASLLVLLLPTVVDGQSSILVVPVAAAIAAITGAILAAVTMPPKSRRAFETFAWLGRREMTRFAGRTRTPVPTDPAAVERWLQDNPFTSATAFGRLELLAMLGRTDEAAAEQALMPPPTTDAELVEQALARRFTLFIATGTADESELDALAVRPRLGWAATMTTVRDLWSKIAILMFFVALAIGLVTVMWPR